jgi:hypothetical protein
MENFEGPVSLCGVLPAYQAHLIENFLKTCGIVAKVTELTPSEAAVVVGAQVWVRGSDLAHARTFLADFLRDQVACQTKADWTCPQCGSEVPAAFDECDVCQTSSGTTNPER